MVVPKCKSTREEEMLGKDGYEENHVPTTSHMYSLKVMIIVIQAPPKHAFGANLQLVRH